MENVKLYYNSNRNIYKWRNMLFIISVLCYVMMLASFSGYLEAILFILATIALFVVVVLTFFIAVNSRKYCFLEISEYVACVRDMGMINILSDADELMVNSRAYSNSRFSIRDKVTWGCELCIKKFNKKYYIDKIHVGLVERIIKQGQVAVRYKDTSIIESGFGVFGRMLMEFLPSG